MACMRSGVLLKLLEELNHDEKGWEEDRKPVLLQIRSIIPVLEEGDLWPNRGFYLKVSDLSHAIYVSLPQEQNEMILSNKLKLGQLIHVQRLEASHPVPLLVGVTPVPGRRPCDGTREDILPANNLVKFLDQASDTDSIVEKGVISEKKISESLSDSRKFFRGSSDSEALTSKCDGDLKEEARGRGRSSSASKSRPGEPRLGLNYVTKRCDLEKRIFDVMVEIKKTRECSVENDSDSDSTRSSVSSVQLSKRRSWTESEFLRSKEIFDSSTVREKRTVTRSRSRSTNVSPVRSVRGDSSDDNSTSIRRRREINPPKKYVKSSNKTRLPAVKKKPEIPYPPISSSADDTKDAENRITWDSLPSSLVKLGKEVIRERDAAILSAVEALQEACAAQRLIRCLSSYSEFQSSEEDGLQQSVDKFFELQDGLANSRLITHSLTNISPVRTSDADLSSAATVKEVLDLAVERKKNASSWVKSAVTYDLCPFADSLKPSMTTTDPINTLKKPVSVNQVTKPKGATIMMIRKQRRNSDIPAVLAADKDDQVAWSRGSALVHTAELATSLHDECQKWFLNRVEKYLDEVEKKVAYMETDSQRAGMMYRIKRVNDWLESIVGKESSMLNESDIEACGRVRNKIYGILLKHVERTAMALETM